MSTFLTTINISSAIESLIVSANKEIFIVSPYMRIHKRLEQLLLEKLEKGVSVYIIFGKERDQPYIKTSPLIEDAALFFCERLHAKCYLNESEVLVTSMNLFDYSQINNVEFGLHSTGKDDSFLPTRGEVVRIIKESKPFNSKARDVEARISSIENPIFMRDLRQELEKARNIRNDEGRFNLEVCRYLMSLHKFPKSDLYKDGSAILAGTVISKELYLSALKRFRLT